MLTPEQVAKLRSDVDLRVDGEHPLHFPLDKLSLVVRDMVWSLADSHEALRSQAALAEQHATEAESVSEALLVENEALRTEAKRLNRWILRIATVAEKHDHQIIVLLCGEYCRYGPKGAGREWNDNGEGK